MPFQNGSSIMQKKSIQTAIFFIFLYAGENELFIMQ
jgi:hypothetical protein